MAYRFALFGSHAGPKRAGRNPFTGEPAEIGTLVSSDAERAAVRAVVEDHGGVLEAGGATLAVGGAELTLTEKGESLEVTITGAVEPAMDVLFAIATAGRLVVVNTHEKCDEPVPVVTTPEAASQAAAADETLGAELVRDVRHFVRVLLPGYGR